MTADSTTFRPVSGLGRWLTALLAVAVAVDLLALLSGLAERGLLARISTGAFTDAEVTQNDSRQTIIGLTQLAILLVAGLAFIVWFHRAYKNLLAFGADLPHKTGWAIGGWFVPILNLFRPKGIADAIWQASDPELPQPVGSRWSESEAPVFLHVWWVAWVLALIAGRVYLTMSRGIESVAQAQSANTAGLVANAFSAVAGVAAVWFVKGATARQELKAQQTSAVPAEPAANERRAGLGSGGD